MAPVGIVVAALAGSAAVASETPSGTVKALPWGSEVASLHRSLGARVSAVESGLYKVDTQRGRDLVTHGPDTRNEVLAGTHAAAGTAQTPDSQRDPICAADHYQRFLYVYPSGSANRIDTVKPGIQAVVRGMDALLNRDAIESGGGTADYRVACEATGAVAVDAVASLGSSFDSIVSAVRAAGFNLDSANYTIFYDAPMSGICGIGSFLPDETPGATNINNLGGGYAIAYAGCWDVQTAMHENGHNMGAVQYGAPNSTGSGAHCYEDQDVMCYSPDGGDRHQSGTVLRCADRVHFDCNHNDYFSTAPAPGSYLATHWNIGSPANRFLSLGQGPGDTSGGSTVVSLRNRRSRVDHQNAAGGWRYFKLRVPSGRGRLRFTVRNSACGAGCQANLDLYVRRGGKPSFTSYHCRARHRTGGETCSISRPASGNWYAGVYTYSDGTSPFSIVGNY